MGTKGFKGVLLLILMIASLMVPAISTTTVGAPPTLSASPGVTLSPTSARANTRIKFTVTVPNYYAGDNIDNVLVYAPSFTQPIGYTDNLVAAGDNIENAVAPLQQAGENLKLAEEKKKSAGTNIKYAGDNLQVPFQDDWRSAAVAGGGSSAAADNSWVNVEGAGSRLANAADAINNQIEDLEYIYTYLFDAGTNLIRAAGDVDNIESFDSDGADNVRNAGENLRFAADNLRSGNLEIAGSRLHDVANNLIDAAASLDDLDPELAAIRSAGSALQTAGNKLVDAGNFLDNAGYALGVAENYLASAGVRIATVTHLETAGSNLQIAASLLENAGVALPDNVLEAGENLKLAADNLENVAVELGATLGQDEVNAAATDIDQAAENLRNGGKVDITTAGNELISAASNLSAAAAKMDSTATNLQPTTWNLSTITYGVRFDAIGDNVITPGSSKTFVFLWTTPNITTKKDYMISVLVSKEEVTYTSYENLGGLMVTIDGKKPTLTINVTQVGVTLVNVVGIILDNGKATITITASETLQSIGPVTVENSGWSEENFLPPIPLTTTDNLVYTGTFTVGTWDDNAPVVKVASAKDLAGNESTNMENSFTVDTRAPVFIDNGLSALVSDMRDNVVQAGTGTVFRYVDNDASKGIIIRVEDNIANADNGKWVTSVTIDTTAATRDPTIDSRWTKTIILSEGLNSIVKVTATDRTGNSVSDNVENIFIDTRPPAIEFNTVAGKTWDENGELINDNTPEIKVTVTDPGYPTSGLGVAYGNLDVYLNDTDNINPAAPYGSLENKAPWVVSTGVFENLIDNAGKGLVDSTYWIIVRANDNLAHAGDNENCAIAKRSFTIDTSKPVKDVDIVVFDKIGGTFDNPNVYRTTDRIIEGTVTPAEVGGIIKVYFNGVRRAEYDLVATTTSWIIIIDLLAGQTTKIEFTLTDKAGNESDKVLYGYAMSDTTAPTVTITAPESGISTDATSIILEATVTKDIWETYAELMVRIDATSLTVPFKATNVLSAEGKLTRAVELVEGTNTISVSAQDVAGNWSTVKTIAVTRTVTPVTPSVTYPVADVYAFSGNETEYSRSQLKFDIHNIPSGSNILSAKLRLYRLAADNWDGEILLNRVDDQLWGENITAIEFDAQTLTNEETQTSKFISPGWDYLDVKNQLSVDYLAGHTYSSYRLGWANDNGGEPSVGIDDGRLLVIESELDELSIIFSSSEYNGRDPYLEVVYLRPYAVSVSISPTYKSGTPGEALSYTVTAANTGNLDDNYVLTVSDNAGWGQTVFPTSLAVASGALGEATLTVTVPENATPYTMDNITVTATSQTDNLVSDNTWCEAHVEVLRVVEISILPSYQSGSPGENLEYMVTVRNLGNVDDNYDFIAQDNENWGPMLEDDFLEVPAGENMQTTLSVTIPEGADKCTRDNITVTAISQADNSVIDNKSCIAHAAPPPGIGWDALITATFSGGSNDAIFGVRADATSGFDSEYDIPEPPTTPEPPYVRAYFYYHEQTPDELHHSCLGPENLMEWPLRIEYADSVENVILTWSVENVPTEYNVLLYQGEDLVANVRAEDNYTFEVSTGNYDFRIVVGTIMPFTLELTQGWNMISFPVLPVNSSPDSIFGSYYVLYGWDAESKRYVLHADSGSFIEPDPDVEPGVGYWAYVLEDENVDLLGVPVNQLTLSLRLDWNLIGPPYGGSSIADPIDDPDNTVLNWAFTWDANQRRYVTTQLLEPGRGYWVYALGNCSLDLFG